MARQTEIFSIFGQIQSVAAGTLIEAGEAIEIDAKDIPAEASLNDLIASYRA